jgi:hypothetical protein
VFPDTQQRMVFRRLGYGATASAALRPKTISLIEHMRQLVAVEAQTPNCQCRGEGWCECGSSEECVLVTACLQVNQCGCWPFDGSPCDEPKRCAPSENR